MKTLPIAVLLVIAAVVSWPNSCPAQTVQKKPGSSEVEVFGCVDRKDGKFEITNNFWWVLYDLTGQTAGLENHIGDEVMLHGIEEQAPTNSSNEQQPGTLQVTSIEYMVHKNPEGVRPVLGEPDAWPKFQSSEYGLRFRYPSTFTGNATWEFATLGPNFPSKALATAVQVFTASIPQSVYPGSNFVDGGFAVFVDPTIDSDGTCRQFRSIWPEQTSSETIRGITYSHTADGGAACGTATGVDYYHTFQNGLCYEFAFASAEGNGGMDVPCSIQWVSGENERELIRGVLAQVSFSKPQLKRSSSGPANTHAVPSITSFDHSPATLKDFATETDVSWKASDADYVQLRYRCVKDLYASISKFDSKFNAGFGLDCEKVWSNFPPNASMTLSLYNRNAQSVDFVLTIEPFRAGVGYPDQSKTLSFAVSPQRPVKPQTPSETH